MASERSDVVERAMHYPYPAPPWPFVQVGHRTVSPSEVAVDRAGRVRLLAYGSNAAPEMLARKLALNPEPVLVVPAWLNDFDIVYSAHISPYGAVPATLQRSPGTRVRVAVAYLADQQLELISTTEPNYELTNLTLDCKPDEGDPEHELRVYLSRHGCLLVDGEEVALAGVQAEGRRFAELSEPQVLEWARSTVAPQEDIETFVLSNVTDPALAQERSVHLPRRTASTSPSAG